MIDYVGLELKAWQGFLSNLIVSFSLVIYVVSLAVLTTYSAFYISSFIAFLTHRSLREGKDSNCRVGINYSLGKPPKVAVVFPVFNDYEVLSSINAALRMKYPNYLVVVIDDSTDEVLTTELSNLALRNDKVIHLRRSSRRGLKAGALNDAILLLEKYGIKYVLILDADFEPPEDMLDIMVGIAEREEAVIVQGYQRHFKGSNTLFGILYRASMAASIINLEGRKYLDMFPIFTGSCALIRYDVLKEIGFKEGSLSEDWRWSIELYRRFKDPKIIVTYEAYANGSVPKSQKAFWRQQLRWSTGTLREFLNTFLDVMLDHGLSTSKKLGFVLQGLFFSQGVWVYANTVISVVLKFLTGINLGILYPIGIYMWLIGIETIVLAGCVLEGYGLMYSFITAGYLLFMVYYTSFIHTIGTLKALISKKHQWIVTSKRGRYERYYRD